MNEFLQATQNLLLIALRTGMALVEAIESLDQVSAPATPLDDTPKVINDDSLEQPDETELRFEELDPFNVIMLRWRDEDDVIVDIRGLNPYEAAGILRSAAEHVEALLPEPFIISCEDDYEVSFVDDDDDDL